MQQKQPGFTIVELIIVIVVIAVLATIGIVAYNGVQNRAKLVALHTTFDQLRQPLMMYAEKHGEYPNCVLSQAHNGCPVAELITRFEEVGITSVPTKFNDRDILYAASIPNDQWGLRFRHHDGYNCKLGQDMIPTWWSSAPECPSL